MAYQHAVLACQGRDSRHLYDPEQRGLAPKSEPCAPPSAMRQRTAFDRTGERLAQRPAWHLARRSGDPFSIDFPHPSLGGCSECADGAELSSWRGRGERVGFHQPDNAQRRVDSRDPATPVPLKRNGSPGHSLAPSSPAARPAQRTTPPRPQRSVPRSKDRAYTPFGEDRTEVRCRRARPAREVHRTEGGRGERNEQHTHAPRFLAARRPCRT